MRIRFMAGSQITRPSMLSANSLVIGVRLLCSPTHRLGYLWT